MDQQQYTAPATTTGPPAPGTAGIQFGAGAFEWVQHANGTWGWKDNATNRTWDEIGNAITLPTPAATGQPQQQAATAGLPGAFVAPQATQTTDGSTTPPNQDVAASFLDQLPAPNRVNVAGFGRLPTSTKKFVLSGYEAKGYDPTDITEQWDKELPTVGGAKRGRIMPLGSQ